MTTVIGTRVDATTYEAATAQVIEWARAGQSRVVCIANTHSIMQAYDDPSFRSILNAADLVTPDGMPLAWVLRVKGFGIRDRVYGPTLMRHVLSAAASAAIPVGLYGSTQAVLQQLMLKMCAAYPGLNISYVCSPPFGEASLAQDADACMSINDSGARVLFVGLGCPKQERWMAAHRDRVQAVMLGVGAAFDFLAGAKKQAPAWMQRLALEWLFRFTQEPGRLWKRYLYNNPRFALLALAELLGIWRA